MASDLNIVINIGARDVGRDAYAVQLQHEGVPLAGTWAHIDRQALLELEYAFSPHDYGMKLYDALLSGALSRAYQRLIGQAGAEAAIRVQLVIHPDAPELHALPWERLFHVCGGGEIPLAASARTPFSRFLISGLGDRPPVQERPLRFLVAIANPEGLPAGLLPLEVEREITSLATVVAGLPGRVQGTLLTGRTTLPGELRERLEGQGWTVRDGVTSWQAIQRWLPGHNVLHVLAHGQFKTGDVPGQGTAYLLLEHEGSERTPRGGLERVADVEVATGLAGVDPLPQLVFLAACDSARRPALGGGEMGANPFIGLAPKLVSAGVPAVVAMQDLVPMALARDVAVDFYRRLFDHGQVDRALNEARSLAYEQDDFAWAIPVLFLRLLDGRLFTADPVFEALEAMRGDSDYRAFQTGEYVPMPLQALLVGEGEDASQYDQPEPERTGTFDLAEAVLGYLDEQATVSGAPLVLILGGPGTGKSVQMKRLGWRTADVTRWAGETAQDTAVPRPKEFFVPLYLSLEDYWPGTRHGLEDRILDRLRRYVPGLVVRDLQGLSQQMPQARLRILLDAGDTLPEVGQDLVRLTVAVARDNPRHQYVVAMQPSALNWDDLKELDSSQRYVLAIQPLAQRGIRHTLDAEGPTGQLLLDALRDSSLFDLASTPYFLVSMLKKAHRGQIPSSRAGVLQQLLDEALAEIPAQHGMRANAPGTLYAMAHEMQRRNASIWPIQAALRAISSLRGERGYVSEDLYEALVRQRLLLQVGDNAVRFSYSPIQAFCCARALLALPEADQILGEIVSSLGSPMHVRWWEETLVLAAGLLAADPRPAATETFLRLLERIIRGADLLEGTRVYLGARCLLECRSVFDGNADPRVKEELQGLLDHTVDALRWRSDSATEPDLSRRLLATQFLAQLAGPEVAVDMARKVYCRVRQNAAEEWDYEFSSVRFAAAIALRRMSLASATEVLAEITPKLVAAFLAWQDRDIDALIGYSQDTSDLGLQGLAALALGDLHGPLESLGRSDDARRVLDRLSAMLISSNTSQSVRWSVADALSLLDSGRVTQAVVSPLLEEFYAPGRAATKRATKIRKTLAYLIGLLRLRDERAHMFLVGPCLGLDGRRRSKDWRTWVTAITALGRVAAEPNMRLLAEIAAGRAKGKDLERYFPEQSERDYVRRAALEALSNQSSLELWSPEERHQLGTDPALARTYYRTTQEIYWRREAATRAASLGST